MNISLSTIHSNLCGNSWQLHEINLQIIINSQTRCLALCAFSSRILEKQGNIFLFWLLLSFFGRPGRVHASSVMGYISQQRLQNVDIQHNCHWCLNKMKQILHKACQKQWVLWTEEIKHTLSKFHSSVYSVLTPQSLFCVYQVWKVVIHANPQNCNCRHLSCCGWFKKSNLYAVCFFNI